jgi:hypothetical protein
MRPSSLTPLATTSFVVLAAAALSAAITFTSTFKSPDAGSVTFRGKKVAALVISNDNSLRVAGEEALVRELTARGIQGVATYRIAPKEELTTAEKARPWFERAGLEGIVVIRPVSAETRQTYTSGTWMSPNYGTLWGYYGYGWSTVYVLGSSPKERTVTVETTIYSVSRDQLLWAAVSETTNPKDLRTAIEELAKASIEEMQKQGLAPGQAR